MSLQSGLKKFLACTLALTLAGCASAPEKEVKKEASSNKEEKTEEKISVLVPSGAPALGALGLTEDETYDLEIVQGTDVLSAELAKEDSKYDVIIAPINLGVNIYKNTEQYKLDGVLTWGNLYLVGTDESQVEDDKNTAAFGEGAVPGLVLHQLYPEIADAAVYYPSVAEAQQGLLSGQQTMALLAQPAAAATIAKGKENGTEYKVLLDLQEKWQEKMNTTEKGYPQAAVFVKSGRDEQAKKVTDTITAFLDSADDEKISSAIDAYGADKLGVPNAQIATKTWAAQNIHYKSASDAKDDIQTFLDVFGIELPEDIIVE